MKNFKKYFDWIKKNKYTIVLIIIFLFELFLRFYQMDTRNAFGYDQVDNAWAAKNIVVDHQFPLIGMAAKANSGIYVGPFYYYFLAVIYWITNLDPIAIGIAAGFASIFSFWVIFYVSKKLFSKEVAIFAVFFYTFALPSINFDRVQVPINFIPSISLLIFYVLYRITQGDTKKIIILAALTGLFFNIHFTAIFFPIMIVLALPFFPRTRETLKYILISIPAFLIWVLPSTIAEFAKKSEYSGFGSYLTANFHGFHLRRVMQLLGDGLIQFEHYTYTHALMPLKYVLFPLFFLSYLYKSVSREKLIFCYLVLLWFIVPWFGFSTYSGEITDYYFSISRFIALLIISYFFVKIWMIKNYIPKVLVLIILIYFSVTNIISFLTNQTRGLADVEKRVTSVINSGGEIKYQQGVPESYIYYYLMREKGVDVNK